MIDANELMKQTFSEGYDLWMSYAEFVLENWILFDLMEDRTDYKDYYLPEIDLRMRL